MSVATSSVLGMAKTATRPTHRCTECGWTTGRWVGRCGECQTWGSVVEAGAPQLAQVTSSVPTRKAVPIGQVSADLAIRTLTGVTELDRVLGDGLVPGAVVLLAGEPGVGKSTLLLEVASRWAQAGRRTLYVSGEESAAQVRLRAGRTQALADELFLAAETDLGTVLGHIEEVQPSLMVVDSVQTVGTAEADGSPGGVTQVREVTGALVRVAKRRGMAVIIVGHVTKDGAIAGPRMMEHLVDVVLSFEGDRHSGFRLVRATKNRYGPADEVGCFEMAEQGIVSVPDPSGLFTSRHAEPVPGTCITVTMEGRRPLLAELQALVAPTNLPQPRRTVERRRLRPAGHGAGGARAALRGQAVQLRRLRLHRRRSEGERPVGRPGRGRGGRLGGVGPQHQPAGDRPGRDRPGRRAAPGAGNGSTAGRGGPAGVHRGGGPGGVGRPAGPDDQPARRRTGARGADAAARAGTR